jgi:hypothetical protein
MTPRFRPARWRLPRVSRRSALLILGVAASSAMGAAWLAAHSVRDVKPVWFVSYGAALLRHDSDVWSAPGGGRSLGRVAAGTRLGVGGRVAFSAGLWRVDALWVSLGSAGGVLQGFVPAESVVIVAGTAPPLDLSGIDLSTMAYAATGASGNIAWLPEAVSRWEPLFSQAGARHGVDPDLLAIVALVESGGRADVTSGAGAIGLMQVMPGTAADIARWRGLEVDLPQALSDPALNVDFGGYYLARNMRLFGDLEDAAASEAGVARAAAAYNGGPGAAQRWLDGAGLPAETEAYQAFVVGMWRERTQRRSATFERWCRAGGQHLVPAPDCPP